MDASTVAYIAVSIAAINLAYTVIEKSFGGGNALAAKFHTLDKDTTLAISLLRNELVNKVDMYEDNYQIGYNKMNADHHIVEKQILELRAKMAEEYIAKGGLDDLKRDMRDGFAKVDERMGQLQDMIVWSQPQQGQAVGPRPHGR